MNQPGSHRPSAVAPRSSTSAIGEAESEGQHAQPRLRRMFNLEGRSTASPRLEEVAPAAIVRDSRSGHRLALAVASEPPWPPRPPSSARARAGRCPRPTDPAARPRSLAPEMGRSNGVFPPRDQGFAFDRLKRSDDVLQREGPTTFPELVSPASTAVRTSGISCRSCRTRLARRTPTRLHGHRPEGRGHRTCDGS